MASVGYFIISFLTEVGMAWSTYAEEWGGRMDCSTSGCWWQTLFCCCFTNGAGVFLKKNLAGMKLECRVWWTCYFPTCKGAFKTLEPQLCVAKILLKPHSTSYIEQTLLALPQLKNCQDIPVIAKYNSQHIHLLAKSFTAESCAGFNSILSCSAMPSKFGINWLGKDYMYPFKGMTHRKVGQPQYISPCFSTTVLNS